MRSVSLGQVARATSGELVGPGRLMISSVGTDSRDKPVKDLFFALKGEHFDGHSFIGKAVSAGAKAAVVQSGDPKLAGFRRRHADFPLVMVRDTLEALGDLAGWVRERIDVLAVGITGSTGKTCTKDFLASILEGQYPICVSPGTYNNEIGTPLTIFSLVRKDRVLVVEMGARHPGDIGRLAEISQPRFGIITNVGVTHLELFRDPEGVAKAKSELAAALPEDGVLFLNAENRWSTGIARRTRARVVKFGHSRRAHYRATDVRLSVKGEPSFTLSGPGFKTEVSLKVIGRHQVENALAAAACAHELGASPEVIAEGLARGSMSQWRMEVSEAEGGYLVINDAYNASPHSMKAALETLKAVGGSRRTIAVLGCMAELGQDRRDYHLEIGRLVTSLDIDILVCVGSAARDYAVAALETGLPKGSVFQCEAKEYAVKLLRDIVEPGDVILVKASRVMGLESVAEAIGSSGFLMRAAANV
ncbi:MAG: UDP-N-acetylmuramoyl-tripeptide--D-alanyl-D-alanine ligase [Actinobacteria bacterium]|nr:UDP-N-acetylmuramoyl-tripeptide--D-alanyl-D-alanine ligase [Actinomycetota bacterium]